MNKEQKVKQALLQDFKELLQPEFTTNWKAERFLLEMYINVMSIDNLMKVIGDSNDN